MTVHIEKPDTAAPLWYALLLVPTIFLHGMVATWALRKLWSWFVLPVIPALAVPDFWITYGFMLTLRYLIASYASSRFDPRPWQDKIATDLFAAPVGALLTLLFGAIIRGFAS